MKLSNIINKLLTNKAHDDPKRYWKETFRIFMYIMLAASIATTVKNTIPLLFKSPSLKEKKKKHYLPSSTQFPIS